MGGSSSTESSEEVSTTTPLWKKFYEDHPEWVTEDVELQEGQKHCVFRKLSSNGCRDWVIFIHGSCARLGQFSNQLEYLSDSEKCGRDLNVLSFDRIGCGASSKPRGNEYYSQSNIYDNLCKLIDKFVIREDGTQSDPSSSAKTAGADRSSSKADGDEKMMMDEEEKEMDSSLLLESSSSSMKNMRLILVGHSFGCSQCLKLSCDLTDRYGTTKMMKDGDHSDQSLMISLSGVILLGCPDLTQAEMLDSSAMALFSLPETVLSWMAPKMGSTFRNRALHNDGPNHDELVSMESSIVNPPFMFRAFYTQSELCGLETVSKYSEMMLPTLIIHGSEDEIVSLDRVERTYEAIQKCQDSSSSESAKEGLARLVCLDKCKHQVMQEYPMVVNRLVQEFVDQCWDHETVHSD